MKNDIKCLKYLLKHKFYVIRECFKEGLYWRGLVHDMSKFLPSEWKPYREYFYGGEEFRRCVQENFDRAWLRHQHRNKHHWQHWVLRMDDGDTVCIEMPHKYVIEMCCDWVGARLAIRGNREVDKWYNENRDKFLFHPETRKLVEANLIRIVRRG